MSAIVVIGGTGFIGRHVSVALSDAGHTVRPVGRREIDLARDDAMVIASRLMGAQAVVNAAGLIRGRGSNSLEAVHVRGVERLIDACLRAQVPRLIHVSALGASPTGATAYQRTKGKAEELLAARHDLERCVLRPSVVIGHGGASTRMLGAIAALPVPPRIGPGTWQVQPIHVDDLAELVVRLVERDRPLPRRLDVVGPTPMTTDTLTAILRLWLGLKPRTFLPFPEPALAVTVRIGEHLMGGPLNRETIAMLKAGNVSDPGPAAEALGRPPRPLSQALTRHPAGDEDRREARLFFLRPALRWSLGLLWVATALLSFGLYPLADSYRLLAEAGLHGATADVALFGAATLDLILGLLLLTRWRPVLVGAAMLATMAAFTAIAVALPPDYWLHPFAPLLKNIPIAAGTLVMMALEA